MTEASIPQRQNRRSISLDDPAHLEYWTGALHVSRDKLARAVSAVGHSTAMVKHWLSQH